MKSEYERTHCLVCNGNDFSPYSEKGQFGLPTHVVICRMCGFSYLNPRWTKERYDQFYTKEYDHYYRPEIIGQNDVNYRYSPVKKILARMDERAIKSSFSKVLDIGSGMGHALIYLKKNIAAEGVYEAIEPSENCKSYLEENGIAYLSNDVYAGWDKGKESSYDFVIMRHVLEHFHQPLEVLKKARAVLADNGILYIGVPDAFHPTRPLRSHFFRIVHISYFSKISISNLLKKAGLEVIAIAEGDQHEKNEIFVFCKKGTPGDFKTDPGQFDVQKAIYDEYGKKDLYYELKGKLIAILRKLRIIK